MAYWAAQGKRDRTVQRLAEEYDISRQTVNNIGRKARKMLPLILEPGRHGPAPEKHTVEVTRDRLTRGCVVLTEVGVSQRDISLCLDELLDRGMSSSWVNAELAEMEARAAEINALWQPEVDETLSGDEIYSNGQPNLLVVGNDSLYIYALTRQPVRDGETWGCVLLDAPDAPQFASDGGKGLAAGVKKAGVEIHQLDWDHLLRPLWGQAGRLEERAYAALEAVEERVAKFDQSHTTGRLKQHWDAWEKLEAKAEEKIAHYDAFFPIARRVDDWFALIDLESGELRDPVKGAQSLRDLGEELEEWDGGIYEKLSRNLDSFADGLFSYQPVLEEALSPLVERWGPQAIRDLSQIWQIEADEKRRSFSLVEQQARQELWEESLDEAVVLLGEEQLWKAWDAVCDVLGRSWRGSMLAECVNSLLRPMLDGRKQTDQGCLELFRFLHNGRPFKRGKREGKSPAQLAGLNVPDDPLTLLGLA
jgi:hypothetical protein